jgi:hypothetical protein
MSYYRIGDSFKWFIARVVDIKDTEKLGRVKIRVIHEQTGELGKKSKSHGITDDDLLWAWPITSIQSASLSWKKIVELEGYPVPDWIDAVGLSPTGIAVSTYVFGFYLDGFEENIPVIFGTYHKNSRYPEPPTDNGTGEMLQIEPPTGGSTFHSDVSLLARGTQSLPKAPYAKNRLGLSVVDEPTSPYKTEYPYNTTYTTKSGHAIELDDTPKQERIHIWHKSGSYEEVANTPEYQGRRVLRTTDDSFEVVDKTKNELIGKNHNVEITNNQTIYIGDNQVVDIGENCTVRVGRNCTVIVQGELDVRSIGAMRISSATSITMNAPIININ